MFFLKRFIFLILICTSFLIKGEEIIVGYPEFSPFTFTLDNTPTGIGINSFSQVAKKLNLNYKFIPVNTYGNGIRRLAQNKIDLFLLATESPERNVIGDFSKPILINEWSWFSLKGSNFDFQTSDAKSNLKISTYEQSNTHKWLLKQEYQLIYSTTDINAMLRQLQTKRIDGIFLAKPVLIEALTKTTIRPDSLDITIESARPMGIYVSKSYTKKNPLFLSRLNNEIVKLQKQ